MNILRTLQEELARISRELKNAKGDERREKTEKARQLEEHIKNMIRFQAGTR